MQSGRCRLDVAVLETISGSSVCREVPTGVLGEGQPKDTAYGALPLLLGLGTYAGASDFVGIRSQCLNPGGLSIRSAVDDGLGIARSPLLSTRGSLTYVDISSFFQVVRFAFMLFNLRAFEYGLRLWTSLPLLAHLFAYKYNIPTPHIYAFPSLPPLLKFNLYSPGARYASFSFLPLGPVTIKALEAKTHRTAVNDKDDIALKGLPNLREASRRRESIKVLWTRALRDRMGDDEAEGHREAADEAEEAEQDLPKTPVVEDDTELKAHDELCASSKAERGRASTKASNARVQYPVALFGIL
ncbi:hypothetical protein NMY22_g12036 [Coprinellus aureogranulatus]|nr:hypothetical protein NMY22_g12036 [Coprinellus aureogranulatus]